MKILRLTKSAVRGISTDQSGLPYVHFYPDISSCCDIKFRSEGFFKGEIVRMFSNRYCHRA